MARSRLDIWNRALGAIGVSHLLSSENDQRPEAEQCNLLWDDVLLEVLAAAHWRFARRQAALSQIGTQTTTVDGDGSLPTFQVPWKFADPAALEVVHIAVGGGETELTIVDDYALDFPEDGTLPTVTPTVTVESGESLRFTVTREREGWDYLWSLPAGCVTPLGLNPEGARWIDIPKEARIKFEVMDGDDGSSLMLCTNDDDFESLEYVGLKTDPGSFPALFTKAMVYRLAAYLVAPLQKDEKLEVKNLRLYGASIAEANASDQNTGEAPARPMTPSEAAR